MIIDFGNCGNTVQERHGIVEKNTVSIAPEREETTMAMDKIGDGLKKFLLVGIGAAATTVEKSSQIVDELIKKGEITVEQGKELNKELQNNVKKTMDARKADAATVEEKLAKMSSDELAALKQKIAEAEKAFNDVAGVTEGDEAAAASAELDAMDDDLKDEGYAPAEEEEKAEA